MNIDTVRTLSRGAVKQRIRLEAIAHADGQKAVTRCAKCRWSYRGSIREGKQAFQTHRERCA